MTDTTSPSTEQISEMAPKITEDIAKKSEPKPLKTNKKPKDEEKKLSKPKKCEVNFCRGSNTIQHLNSNL